MCPGHLERIKILTTENFQFKQTLSEREKYILELQQRLQIWEKESITWKTLRTELELRIRQLEAQVHERRDWVSLAVLREKETIIINLNERIRILLADLENQRGDHEVILIKMRETIEKYEKQMLICKGKGFLCNCKEPQQRTIVEQHSEVIPALPERWYYAVQDPSFAQLFQRDPSYKGGEIFIDALDGATVVNPEYYSQSESVPGMSRLRIRVVDYVAAGWSAPQGTELFVRLKLGEATQFTQARPFLFPGVAWHQDMVFVEVPLRPVEGVPSASSSVHPLIIELVSRVIGTVEETLVGTVTFDLADLIQGLTRTACLTLSSGGAVNVRVKALDFGLPERQAGGVRTWTTTKVVPVDEVVQQPQQAEMISITSTSLTKTTSTSAENKGIVQGGALAINQ
jgi:hypothetical protein